MYEPGDWVCRVRMVNGVRVVSMSGWGFFPCASLYATMSHHDADVAYGRTVEGMSVTRHDM